MSSRIVFIALGVVALVIALIYGFMPETVVVELAEVERKNLKVVILEEGKTRIKEHYQISAPVAGSLYRMPWKVGDTVTKDQVLLEISARASTLLDSRTKAEAENRVEAAQAALNTAKAKAKAAAASAEFASSEYQRLNKIYQKKLIAYSQLQQAEASQRRAIANQESAEFASKTALYQLNEARNALNHFASGDSIQESIKIVSPINGQILMIQEKSQRSVETGEVLLEIGNTRQLEIVSEVLSSDAVKIKEDMTVELAHWGGSEVLQGYVHRVEPVAKTKISALGVEEQRVNVIVEIVSEHEDWQALGEGYRVDTGFILWQADDVLQIPENSLFKVNDQWAVFKLSEDNRVDQVMVQIGRRNGVYAEVLEGLSLGDQVVLYPGQSLQAGVTVSSF